MTTDASKVLASKPPRERSGASSANRFTYELDWALCKLIELHDSGQDYRIVLDHHEDVLVLDQEHGASKVDFYQIKTDQGLRPGVPGGRFHVEKYQGFGIDLDKASGRNHHLLPMPAVYIVDTKGVIRFAHWDADYKKRLTPEDLLTAAKRVAGQYPQPSLPEHPATGRSCAQMDRGSGSLRVRRPHLQRTSRRPQHMSHFRYLVDLFIDSQKSNARAPYTMLVNLL